MAQLAVYIHWPYCLNKCPYCDFNSHVAETIDHAVWQRSYGREIAYWADRIGPANVTSVFFGGGTPSLMAPDSVAACLQAVASAWDLADDAEITLEANPTSVETGKLAAFRAAGVNRLSLGVQALNGAALNFLGRQHDVAETRVAIETAAQLFDHWSMDLIYARPDQTVADWISELEDALTYEPEHISAYQLTIEKGTPFFADHRAGVFELPEEEAGAAFYDETNARLQDAGLARYEISNYARPGAESQHNLAYWFARDYVGIGPGAHGRLMLNGAVRATRQIAAPAGWLDAVQRDGHGTQEEAMLDVLQLRDEVAMMGLRLSTGIDKAAFAARVGIPFERAFSQTRLLSLQAEGLLAIDAHSARATAQGLVRLNSLLVYLLSR